MLNQLLHNLANTTGVGIAELLAIDPGDYIKSRLQIHGKDRARIIGLGPALIKRSTELALVLMEAIKAENYELAEAISQSIERFYREAGAVGADFADIKPSIGDPTKNERESLRIFAKRNELDPTYQELLGVSEGTPSVYPQSFLDKYLPGGLR